MHVNRVIGGLLLGAALGICPMILSMAEMSPSAASQAGGSLRQPHGKLFYLYEKKVNVSTEEHKARAKALILEGKDYPLALAELNLVIGLDSEDAEALLLRGIAYTEMDKFQEAENDYKAALMLEPENPTFYYYRGINQLLDEGNWKRSTGRYYYMEVDNHTYEIGGSLARALEMFKKALEIEPNYIDAIVGMGDMYYNLGKVYSKYDDGGRSRKAAYQKAIDQYNKVLVLFGNNDILKAKKEQAEQAIWDVQYQEAEKKRKEEISRRIG